MHDLVAAQDIVKKSIEIAKKNRLKKIDKITVPLGQIIEHNQQIIPENLKFNFELVKKNTIAENASLEIKNTKGRKISIDEVQGEK